MAILQARYSDTNTSRVINTIIVCGLRVFGLAPFSIRQTTEPKLSNSRKSCRTSVFVVSKIGLAYNVLLSIIVVTAVAASTSFESTDISKFSVTEAVIAIETILRTSACSVVLLSWAFRQRSATSILNRLLEYDRLLSGMNKDLTGEKKSFTLFTAHVIANAFIVASWAPEGGEIVDWFLNWLSLKVPILITYWHTIAYTIVLATAAREFEKLNKNLTKFEELPNCLFRGPSTRNHNVPVTSLSTGSGQLATLELLHRIRTALTEVSQDIADFFSLPILLMVAIGCVGLLDDLYSFFIALGAPTGALPMSLVINAVGTSFAVLLPLVSLSFYVTRTIEESKQTGLIVHKLLVTAREKQIETKLKRFSLQMLHEDLSFTAYGFFALDFTLIQAIIAFTVSYLVIMVQFS